MDAVMLSSSVDGSMSNGFNHHSLSYPFPMPVSNFSRIGGANGGGGILMKHPLPPLLPLPTNAKPYSSSPFPIRTPNNSNNNNKRGRRALSSSPPTNKKPLNLKRPSKSSTSPKKQDPKSHKESVDKRLGPEPSDLPDLNSIFCLAPPPSSLPLPKFFLKPKIVGCNVQAVNWGGMEDDGATATDNLRRLLRLC